MKVSRSIRSQAPVDGTRAESVAEKEALEVGQYAASWHHSLRSVAQGFQQFRKRAMLEDAERPRPGGHRLPGQRKRALTIRELRRENQELRDQLGLNETLAPAAWELSVDPVLRDAILARALVDEWGNRQFALRRLRVSTDGMDLADRLALEDRLFGAPAVLEKAAEYLAGIEAEKQAMITRMITIAKFGDAADAVRAFEVIARLDGWFETAKPSPKASSRVSVAELLRNQEK